MFYKNIGTKILDVGCSTGNFLIHCSKGSCGVDADAESINVAKKRGLNAEVINIDIEKLPYNDNEFDAVNFISTIEHLREPLNALLEIRRVLKPNGKLIIRAKNLYWWKFKYWDNYNQYTVITKESINQMLLTAGFNDFEIRYIDRGTPFALKLFDIGLNVDFLKRWIITWGYLRKKYIFGEIYNEK